MTDQEIDLLKVLTTHRKAFASYEGPVSFLLLTMTSPAHVTSADTRMMTEAHEWCEDNCASQSWIMWTPQLLQDGDVMDESGMDVSLVFTDESDAALFLLSHRNSMMKGLLKFGYASKGTIVCASVT